MSQSMKAAYLLAMTFVGAATGAGLGAYASWSTTAHPPLAQGGPRSITVSAPTTTVDDAVVRALEIHSLQDRFDQLNDQCRGGSGDDEMTQRACEARNMVDRKLAQMGYCYAATVIEDAANLGWTRCATRLPRVGE